MDKIDRETFKILGRYYMSLFEGDTHNIDDALLLLRQEGIIDEDDEVIYGEDE